MRSLYFSILILAVSISGANAQIGYGPELGFNSSNYTGKSLGKNISNSPKYGGMFGGILEKELSEKFYLLPGLFYYRNGYATSYAGGNKTIAINTFEVPVSISYKFGPPLRVKFFIGAGPYFDINYGGQVVTNVAPIYSTYNIKIGSTADNDIKTFDLGMSAWGVYQITRGLFFRARYQYGFFNMLPKGDANNSLYNRSFSLSIGYMFPGDLKAKKEPQMLEEKAEKQKKDNASH